MSEPFDWEKVGEELEALVEAIDEERPEATVEVYPMVTNEFGMEVLQNLWDRGYRVGRRPTRTEVSHDGWSYSVGIPDVT